MDDGATIHTTVGAAIGGVETVRTDATDGGGLDRLAGQLNLLNARLVAATESLLASGEWEIAGMRSPSHYLAWQTGLSPERAKLVVRVARRRNDFPIVIAAFDCGELSLEQVARRCVRRRGPTPTSPTSCASRPSRRSGARCGRASTTTAARTRILRAIG